MAKIITDKKAVEAVIDSFARTTDQIFTLEELRKLLLSGKQLRMKYGVDVTAPNMHIGHAVNLWMYRSLQELGHKLVFLIGDFTTQIGDPTGKSKTRPIISQEEIKANADAFVEQAKMVVHDDPDLVEIRRNSEWFDRMPTREFLGLLRMITHDRLISREMFQQRIKEGREIYMHEMVYPIIQGYDSVALDDDITIIGSDQLYNEMLGRFYQEKFDKRPQIVLTTKITPGIDGKEKQSKSLGNYIGLGHTPREKFGRLMSIPDSLIVQYLDIYTDVPATKVEEAKIGVKKDPMYWKRFMAHEVVRRYHGAEVADAEEEWFANTFSKKETPSDLAVVSIGADKASVLTIVRKCVPESEMSGSDLRRLIEQGGVKINDVKKTDIKEMLLLGGGIIVKLGKRKWYRITP